jgi:cysteine sulfinate desulfinase/cysteine desulfurase-like protein
MQAYTSPKEYVKSGYLEKNVKIIFNISGCLNLSFAYVEGESLLMALKDVALSSGR